MKILAALNNSKQHDVLSNMAKGDDSLMVIFASSSSIAHLFFSALTNR